MLLTLVREVLLDLHDLAFVDRQVTNFRPDVIYLGHVTNLSKGLVPHLAEMPLVYDEGGSGLIHLWTDKGIWYKLTDEIVPGHSVTRSLMSLVVDVVCRISGGRLRPRFAWPKNMHVVFNSALNQANALAAGVPVDGAEVVRSGVDTNRFTFHPREAVGMPLRIVVPARFEPKKGHLSAVSLMTSLADAGVDARMTMLGERRSVPCFSEVERAVRDSGLAERVQLLPPVSQERMSEYYRETDVCFFPSMHRTGFSRAPLEAMASGCVVISYGNEGSDEIIRDGNDGFLVQPADFAGIVAIIGGLISNPERVRLITAAARKTIETRFSLELYVDRLERVVLDAAKGE
jgi:glycosyltransferase involved in cell wall biosynthesis